jgi:Rieske Fe-S protein
MMNKPCVGASKGYDVVAMLGSGKAMSEKIGRSEFLKAVALTAVAAGALTLSPVGVARAQEKAASKNEWEAALGKVKDLNEKAPVLVKAQFKDADGNLMEEEKVFVRWDKINKNTGRWVVLSAFCTHLKCVLEYSADDDAFLCPCHGSQFDLEGTALKRPAKSPLPDYSDLVEERDGQLILKREATK